MNKQRVTVGVAMAIVAMCLGCRTTVGPTHTARVFALSGNMRGHMSTEVALQLVQNAMINTLRNDQNFDVRRATFDAAGFEVAGFPKQYNTALRGKKMNFVTGKWRNIQSVEVTGPPGRKQATITIGVHRSDMLEFDYETTSRLGDVKLADLVQAFVTLYDLNVTGG